MGNSELETPLEIPWPNPLLLRMIKAVKKTGTGEGIRFGKASLSQLVYEKTQAFRIPLEFSLGLRCHPSFSSGRLSPLSPEETGKNEMESISVRGTNTGDQFTGGQS